MKQIKDLKLTDLKLLKDLDVKKLQQELTSAMKKMFELKAKLEVNELKQTHLIKSMRRYVAQLNTLISQK